MWQFVVFAVLGFWGLLVTLKLSFPYLAPFFLGLVLAVFLDIPVSYLETLGFSRACTTFVLTFVTFLGLPIILVFCVLQLWQETKGLVKLAPWLSEQVTQFFEGLPWIATPLTPLNLTGSLELLLRWVYAIPDLLVIWVLAAFSAYFFCKDKSLFTTTITRHLPHKWRRGFFQLYHDTSRALCYLFRVQLILMGITSTLSMLFFYLLQLPYPILLGLAVGFVDLVPVAGPGLIYLCLAVVQIYLGHTQVALALGVAYLIVLLIRQFAEPHLVSERLDLHPLIAVIALYIGFRFWGLLGALIGPLIMVFLKALINTYITT